MKEKSSVLYKILALYFIFALFLNYNSTSALPKIVGMLTIAIAAYCFLHNADIKYAQRVFSTSIPFYLQVVFLLTISCGIWIVSTQTMPYMMPGFTRLLYTVINITVAVCAAYVFGKDCIEFAFLGSIIYHAKIILLALRAAGLSNAISDFFNTIMGGDTGVFMGMLEVNEPTFCVGIFFMYFLFCEKEDFGKRKYIYLALSTIFLLTGFKRNIVGAIAAAAVIGFVMKKAQSKGKDLKIALITGIFAILGCFFYVFLIKSNIFVTVMQEYGVNLMSREGLYEFIGDQYDFSPFFIGRGFGFVEHYLVYVKTLGLKYAGSSLEHIHNDLLLYYIEEGFWGYLGWLVINCIWYPIWWHKKGNSQLCLIYTIFNVYNLITFTTDNMSSSYQVTLTYRLILMGCFATYYLQNKTKVQDKEINHGNSEIQRNNSCL